MSGSGAELMHGCSVHEIVILNRSLYLDLANIVICSVSQFHEHCIDALIQHHCHSLTHSTTATQKDRLVGCTIFIKTIGTTGI